jgi:hypothetical protein
MIDKSKSKLILLEYSILTYFVLFLLNLIYVNIMVTRPDTLYLSDVMLWIHLFFMISGYIYIKYFQKHNDVQFVVSIYRYVLLTMLMLHIIYFISVYLQSYLLIDETLIIIRDKILRGNPALILDFSNVNYTTLSYVTGLLQGINSPLILLFLTLWTARLYYTANHMQQVEETPKKYDYFLFPLAIPIFWFLLVVASFLSINLLTIRYDVLQSLEMFMSMIFFSASLIGFLVSYAWFKRKNMPSKPSQMTSLHRFLSLLLLPLIILSLLLLMYHVLTNFQTYRIYSVLASIGIILILSIFHLRLRRLD